MGFLQRLGTSSELVWNGSKENVKLHQICPLGLQLGSLHFATNIGREYLKDPSIGVLVGK